MGKLTIAIVGGGAAGFFAAIQAKRSRPENDVIIFERASQVLAKVAVTGGGRCNVTNSFEGVSDLKQVYPRGFRLMKRLFNQLDYNATYEWFEQHGVDLVVQDDHCVFPFSQDAQSIVRCLTDEAHRLGVRVKTSHRLQEIVKEDSGRFRLVFEDRPPVLADRVAITTGGMPKTEDPMGLQRLGHEIVQPIASLFTFNIKQEAFQALMGTVVNPVIASITSTKFRAEGPLLITHWGMSGPAILKLSSHAARHLREQNYRVGVAVNWAAEPNRDRMAQLLGGIVKAHPQKQLLSIRPFDLPTRLWQYLLAKIELPEDRRWGELGNKGMNRLIEVLTNDVYLMDGKGAYRDEFVTCGGVALQQVDSNTLESKVCPGLYFAGEVLDIDAVTGGCNLQAAWTTGYVVGSHIND